MLICTRGETDIITVFGTVVSGSSPDGCTKSGRFCAGRRPDEAETGVAQKFIKILCVTTKYGHRVCL